MEDKVRRRFLTILIGLVLLTLAFFVGRATSPEREPVANPEIKSPASGPGPTAELNGVPVGYSHTEEGAIAAATIFAKEMSHVTSDLNEHISRLTTMSSPEWRDEAEEMARNNVRFLRETYGEGVIDFVPVRFRVLRFAPDSATVDIWGMTLISGPEPSSLRESWVIGTVELSWQGDWRVAGGSSRPGPSPTLLQEESGDAADVSDFEPYEDAARP